MFDSEAVLLQPTDAGDDRRMEAARRWIKHQPRSFARSVSESAAARLHVMQRLDDRFDMAILGFVQKQTLAICSARTRAQTKSAWTAD